MRLARKLPSVRPLSELVVHLCGWCGYVGTSEREPEPPAAHGSKFGFGQLAALAIPILAAGLFLLPRRSAS